MFARPIYAKIKRTADWPKDGEAVYSDIEANNFVLLRDALKGEQILAYPDWTRPFELHTDACRLGLGAVVVQQVGAVDRPISFASRSLTKAESNYSQWELECLAIVWAMRLFRMYLALAVFLVVTDATAAKRIMEGTKNDAGRVVRWALAVQEFDYTIVQRPARELAAPDGLSRYSHESTEPYNEGETTVEPSTWLTTIRPGNAFFSDTFFDGVSGYDHKSTAPCDGGRTPVEPNTWLTPVRPDGTYEAFFGNEDHTAETVEEWKLLQGADEWCKRKLVKACSDPHEALPGDLYVGANALLYRKSPSGNAADQVLVPVSLRAYILNRYHGLPVTGHMGRRRTHNQVSAFFWWQGMYKDIAKWVAACLTCKKRKTPRNMHAGVPSAVSTSTRPWETVALDIVSAKPSKEGYVKILTILDTFTRYVITVPLKSKTAEEVSKALMNNLFCVFGRPDNILTDDGKEFINGALRAVNKRWGVHHHSTGGYQPHALPVERYHRFLNSAMTTLSMTFGDDWPSYLPAATFAYNASTNDATGYSPYELVMAKGSPVLLQHIELQPKPAAGAPLGESVTDFYKQAGNRIMAAYAHVRDQQQRILLQRNEAIMARKGVRQRKMVTYDIGDNVLFWEPRQSMTDMEAAAADAGWTEKPPAKWTYNWSGPHMIIGKDAEASGFRYSFYHNKRRQLIETHNNKLAVFEPWSEGILSTSIGIDAKRNYQAGEWAPTGELVLVPMTTPEPFGIGRIRQQTEDGDLVIHWYGNASNSPFASYMPAWKDGSNAVYYAKRPDDPSHEPYTSNHDELSIHQCDIVIHGFVLTENGTLTARMLIAIAENPLVWWTKDRIEIEATTAAWDAAKRARTEEARAEMTESTQQHEGAYVRCTTHDLPIRIDPTNHAGTIGHAGIACCHDEDCARQTSEWRATKSEFATLPITATDTGTTIRDRGVLVEPHQNSHAADALPATGMNTNSDARAPKRARTDTDAVQEPRRSGRERKQPRLAGCGAVAPEDHNYPSIAHRAS
jgi:hypothetical protein